MRPGGILIALGATLRSADSFRGRDSEVGTSSGIAASAESGDALDGLMRDQERERPSGRGRRSRGIARRNSFVTACSRRSYDTSRSLRLQRAQDALRRAARSLKGGTSVQRRRAARLQRAATSVLHEDLLPEVSRIMRIRPRVVRFGSMPLSDQHEYMEEQMNLLLASEDEQDRVFGQMLREMSRQDRLFMLANCFDGVVLQSSNGCKSFILRSGDYGSEYVDSVS